MVVPEFAASAPPGSRMTALLSKLGLGASHFGAEGQGARGRGPEAEVREVLRIAGAAGLSVLDVSGTHGAAETLVGHALPRPVPFRLVLNTARCDRGADFVEAELHASLRRLGVDRADALIVPSAGDLFGPHGLALWDRLKRLKDDGYVGRIGVSVYASDDPLGVVKRFKPDLVQAPASLLDQRLLADGTLAAISGLGVEVQLRSIFLSGLLFLPPDRIPGPLQGASSSLSRVRRLIAEGRSDPLQAALAFALSRREAASVLVGVTTAAELSAVISAASRPLPDFDWEEMAIQDPAVLDSRRWAAA